PEVAGRVGRTDQPVPGDPGVDRVSAGDSAHSAGSFVGERGDYNRRRAIHQWRGSGGNLIERVVAVSYGTPARISHRECITHSVVRPCVRTETALDSTRAIAHRIIADLYVGAIVGGGDHS